MTVRKRKAIRKEVQEEVMSLCRRRCCICFGLHRNTDIKSGQIAHLDDDASNNDLDNLAFLCFEHHDQYDSKTSQSKGLMPQEVRRYRRELHEAVARWAEQPTEFTPRTIDAPGVEGRYVRQGDFDQAELYVQRQDDGELHVSGFAVWGTHQPLGPNTGEIDFVAPVTSSNSTSFTEPSSSGEYRLDIQFNDRGAVAKEVYAIGFFGMNVSFDGVYTKVSSASSSSTTQRQPPNKQLLLSGSACMALCGRAIVPRSRSADPLGSTTVSQGTNGLEGVRGSHLRTPQGRTSPGRGDA